MSTLRDALQLRRLENVGTSLPYSVGKSSTPCLRATASDGKEWIFPWAYLLYGLFVIESESDSLGLTFTTHEVAIVGQNLFHLKEAVSRMTLESVKAAPADYGRCSDGNPLVEAITVKCVEKTLRKDGSSQKEGLLSKESAAQKT